MPELSNRTAVFTDSVIRRMTRVSNQYGAINLSQGFPDFDPPKGDYGQACGSCTDRPTPVCPYLGSAELQGSTGKEAGAFFRNEDRSGYRDCSDLWKYRSYDGSNDVCV